MLNTKRLRSARLRRGWSQGQLGMRIGVTRFAVSHWEQGRREPSLDLLRTIERALHLSKGALLY